MKKRKYDVWYWEKIKVDKDVLKEMIEEDGKAELVCHFCNKKYEFSKEELEDILEKNEK